mmetsp:Transcript_11109/g.24819  ORF Transcript_11109/g.24819 Transcript_11109/m.24819 type:complete len:254 (-) Transcript_11109:1016-1777(-)
MKLASGCRSVALQLAATIRCHGFAFEVRSADPCHSAALEQKRSDRGIGVTLELEYVCRSNRGIGVALELKCICCRWGAALIAQPQCLVKCPPLVEELIPMDVPQAHVEPSMHIDPISHACGLQLGHHSPEGLIRRTDFVHLTEGRYEGLQKPWLLKSLLRRRQKFPGGAACPIRAVGSGCNDKREDIRMLCGCMHCPKGALAVAKNGHPAGVPVALDFPVDMTLNDWDHEILEDVRPLLRPSLVLQQLGENED